MDATKEPKDNVRTFQRRYNRINTRDLDDILEDFLDMGYLSKKGEIFRDEFWGVFVKYNEE
ncbi:MAG: hypothetical protein U9O91_06450 [Candidatus Caldatribacteriota bacterium]|nr:hypothetical protein [Candidatus Caldatribacteriota bacterium]